MANAIKYVSRLLLIDMFLGLVLHRPCYLEGVQNRVCQVE